MSQSPTATESTLDTHTSTDTQSPKSDKNNDLKELLAYLESVAAVIQKKASACAKITDEFESHCIQSALSDSETEEEREWYQNEVDVAEHRYHNHRLLGTAHLPSEAATMISFADILDEIVAGPVMENIPDKTDHTYQADEFRGMNPDMQLCIDDIVEWALESRD